MAKIKTRKIPKTSKKAAEAKAKVGRAPKPKVQEWSNLADQKRMLQYDWKVAKESCPLSLLFASDEIELGEYDGCRPVELEDIRVGEINASYSIRNGGCAECWSDEVYTFRMQEAAGGKVRLVVRSWVECCCNDGELDTCEECDYVAHPVAAGN